ncbi:unnamed protein product [Phyllotreta striolata]|uniref:C2H2-type domain-containing protein n=1 Tax=Phyllotreta striolata TaxID=444603 RepID=A0A9N9TXA6_PHYSR|nr:unnamed protein product [Phyllotreta striolata]
MNTPFPAPLTSKLLQAMAGYPVKIELTEKPSELGSLSFSDAEKPKKKTNRIRGNFRCPQCDRTYIRKDSLQRHLTYECGKEPMFQCPFCPQKCKRRGHQLRHVRRQHKDKIGLIEENNPDIFGKKEDVE